MKLGRTVFSALAFMILILAAHARFAMAAPTLTTTQTALPDTATPTGGTPNLTVTATLTVSVTRSATKTPTPYITASVSATASPTRTASVTRTVSRTATAYITPNPSATTTGGVNDTVTPTVPATPIATATRTRTPYFTPTSIVTAAGTATSTTVITPEHGAASGPVTIHENVLRASLNRPAKIDVKLDHSQRVVVAIYTRSGELIKTLVDRVQNAGTFETAWDGINQNGKAVRSGVYIVQIKTDTFEEKRKIAVIR